MKCAIIDDEPLALDLLESYILKTPMLQLCGRYSSAVEAMSGLQREPADLIFLDIQMPGLSGLDLSRMIDTTHRRIVFTTAFSQYAIEGYKVNALDYLLKPISYTDFIAAVSRAQKWFSLLSGETDKSAEPKLQPDTLADDYFFVKSEHRIVRIPLADILYVEGLKDYVKIHLAGQQRPTLSLMSMRSVEQALPAQRFFRIHRSYIVNIDRVRVFERGQIQIGDKYLPVSDSYRELVQKYINAHLLPGRGGQI
ncbi:MAG: LytR/AlgR family response regulator transcription factor [Alloprevotella sp.]